MGVILAIALDGASMFEEFAVAGPSTLSLVAAAVAVLGLWLWGRQRCALLGPPAPVWASVVPPRRCADVVPPTRSLDRPRRPDLAASSSLLRAPPGVATSAGPGPARHARPPEPTFHPHSRRRTIDPARAHGPG